MAETWVEIWHPEIEGTARRTLTSFEKIHEPKGWNLLDPSESETSNALVEHAWDEDEVDEEDEISDE